MKTTIYFIRHGGFDNPSRIVPGRIPGYNLNKSGREKAKKLGDFFKKLNIKHIYTSPLERTYETANIIGDNLPGVKITHAFELTEVDSLHWQAYKLEELFKNNYYEAFLNDPDTAEVPENLTQLAKRVQNFTYNLCKKHPGEQIICVSHLYPIVALRLILEGKSLTLVKNYDVDYVSVTTFEFDENCRLVDEAYSIPN